MRYIPKAALLIIDVQNGFDFDGWGRRSNPEAEEKIRDLLDRWRLADRPVFFVRHMSTSQNSPLRPGQPGNEIKEIVQPLASEPVIEKQVNSAFIGTDLESQLRVANIDTLIIVGLTAEHCVSTTTRMAANLGFTTFVVSDATASFESTGLDGEHYPAELVQRVSLATLNGEFATVLTAEQLLDRFGLTTGESAKVNH